MSEAQSQILVNQIISYQQPLKEPNPAIGKVVDVHTTYIVVEHLSGAKNTIPITLSYEIVAPETSLTVVPTIKKIIHNGTTYAILSKVSYTLKGHPEPLKGQIKKITLEKDRFHLLITHKNREQSIPIEQPDLKLVADTEEITVYPEVQPVEVPFKVGNIVSYSLTGADDGEAIGQIVEINTNREGTTFKISHIDGEKIMTYKLGERVVGKFKLESTNSLESLTPAPQKTVVLSDGVKLNIGDRVSFRLKRVLIFGIIKDFNYKYNPYSIIVIMDDGTDKSIPTNQPELKKVVEGRQKYILEDVNKYRLKYAKYKAKYLLLK